MNLQVPFSPQQRINNILLLNSSFIDNLGLLHGKMGIAIYFFHLARESKNSIYNDYAGELIDEVYEEISTTTPLDFENGLAGIGWGIEYLVQHGFIEADTDEVLESIDYHLDPATHQTEEIGLLNGLTGLGAYYLKRVQNPCSSDEKLTTLINKQMLVHLIDKLERQIETIGITNLINEGENKIDNYSVTNDPAIFHTEPNHLLKKENTEIFNLTWDYPLLIMFLSEVYQLNLINFKVGSMLQQLIAPLFQPIKYPRLHSKRLLLAFAIEKSQNRNLNLSNGSFDEITLKLLTGLKRETISIELAYNSALLQDGSSGIAWLYSQLFLLTGEIKYKSEAMYWSTKSLKLEKPNQGYADNGLAKENKDKAYGLLAGLAGINFTQRWK